jgi:phage tail sheath protein FI
VVRGIVARDVGAEKPLRFLLPKGEQDVLNPRGINVIRDFRADGRGIRLWGARTMSSDPMWKYVNVRRLFLFVEESIDQGTQWVVFEPNDEPLWAAVRRSVSNFLISVWRSGALMGGTQDEAFFVKCDRTTMTQDDIDNGRLICLIGIAPVKPAEFVIFRISQKTAEAAA